MQGRWSLVGRSSLHATVLTFGNELPRCEWGKLACEEASSKQQLHSPVRRAASAPPSVRTCVGPAAPWPWFGVEPGFPPGGQPVWIRATAPTGPTNAASGRIRAVRLGGVSSWGEASETGLGVEGRACAGGVMGRRRGSKTLG